MSINGLSTDAVMQAVQRGGVRKSLQELGPEHRARSTSQCGLLRRSCCVAVGAVGAERRISRRFIHG